MALRLISRTTEEQNALNKRFGIAQDAPTIDPADREAQLNSQRDIREKIAAAALILDIDVADSREKSLALTKLEEALMWAGKAIFS